MTIEERINRMKAISAQIAAALEESMKAFECELDGLTDDIIAYVEKATAARIADYVRHVENDKLADAIERSERKQPHFIPLSRREGVVLATREDDFDARLTDLDGVEQDIEVTFEMDEVSLGDRSFVVDGAIFYWTIGYLDSEYGQRTTSSEMRFRRPPAWQAQELRDAQQRAGDLLMALGIPDARSGERRSRSNSPRPRIWRGRSRSSRRRRMDARRFVPRFRDGKSSGAGLSGRAMTRVDLEARLERVENALISVRDDASALCEAAMTSTPEARARIERLEAAVAASRMLVPPR